MVKYRPGGLNFFIMLTIVLIIAEFDDLNKDDNEDSDDASTAEIFNNAMQANNVFNVLGVDK